MGIIFSSLPFQSLKGIIYHSEYTPLLRFQLNSCFNPWKGLFIIPSNQTRTFHRGSSGFNPWKGLFIIPSHFWPMPHPILPKVSIPERDYLSFRERHSETCAVFSFQGAFATTSWIISLQLSVCKQASQQKPQTRRTFLKRSTKP